jgi:hypothetical protein
MEGVGAAPAGWPARQTGRKNIQKVVVLRQANVAAAVEAKGIASSRRTIGTKRRSLSSDEGLGAVGARHSAEAAVG